MANIKISELTPKGSNLASTDLLEISEDAGGGTYVTKSITGAEIIAAASGGSVAWGDITGNLVDQTDLQTALSAKQNTLVSGTNIKTIEGQSLLGSGNIDLTKSDVGLANVDNTSDLNKPISTATQTALNAKQNALTLTTTGTSGAATLVGSTLNIPQYGGGGASGLKGVHTLLPLSFNQSTSAIITTPANLSNVGLTANRLVLYPFIPANSFTAETMFINCTTLLSGANARILIYSDLNGSPNSKLMESTDLSLSTTGQKSYVSFFDFVAGTTYWLGVHASTGGSVTHMAASSIMPIYNFGINVYVNYFVNVALGSAPATITSKTPNTTNTPFIGMIAI
jgi:hypothetical protein